MNLSSRQKGGRMLAMWVKVRVKPEARERGCAERGMRAAMLGRPWMHPGPRYLIGTKTFADLYLGQAGSA